MNRGLFILFESGDKSGKSTQCKLLVEHLKKDLNLNVKLYSFPDRLEPHSGETLNKFLKKKESLGLEDSHLLFSDNRWFLAEQMKKDLESGTFIVCDRYSYSGIVYTASNPEFRLSAPFTKRYFKENIKPLPIVVTGSKFDSLIQTEVGLIAPDLVIFLEIPPEIALKRGNKSDEEVFESLEMQQRVVEQYKCLCHYLTGDSPRSVPFFESDISDDAEIRIQNCKIDDLFNKIPSPWYTVDAQDSIISVSKKIKSLFDKYLVNFIRNGGNKPLSFIDFANKPI